jgi:hypothetical protein
MRENRAWSSLAGVPFILLVGCSGVVGGGQRPTNSAGEDGARVVETSGGTAGRGRNESVAGNGGSGVGGSRTDAGPADRPSSAAGAGAGGRVGNTDPAPTGPVSVTRICKGSNATCKTTRSADAPNLPLGQWVNIGPSDVPFGDKTLVTFTQGIAIDPCDPSTLYLTVNGFDPAGSKAGLYKSTNGGASWRRVGRVMASHTQADHIDEPIRVRVDPRDSQHLYIVDGVRGDTQGFWVSCDGGETFFQPDGFAKVLKDEGISNSDAYDVAADPANFDHLLVSFHSAWGWSETKWNMAAGVLESKDGGNSWVAHPPVGSEWGYGHSIAFLSNPSLNIGDSDTWMLGTQGRTFWRTSNGGQSWQKVTDQAGISHGGATIYYDAKGALYVAGSPTIQRSTDNGLTWTGVGQQVGETSAVLGDGVKLYSGPHTGPASTFVSPESNGQDWSPLNNQQFVEGPFELAYDAHNGILYSGSWQAGMWAMRVK